MNYYQTSTITETNNEAFDTNMEAITVAVEEKEMEVVVEEKDPDNIENQEAPTSLKTWKELEPLEDGTTTTTVDYWNGGVCV